MRKTKRVNRKICIKCGQIYYDSKKLRSIDGKKYCYECYTKVIMTKMSLQLSCKID